MNTMCSQMEQWRNARHDPKISESIRARIQQLAIEEITYDEITKNIEEDFKVRISRRSIRRNLLSVGIEKKDGRATPKIKNDQYRKWAKPKFVTVLDKEWAKIRHRESKRRYEGRKREEAFEKLAEGSPPTCGHCGCPHLKAMTIGHINGSRIHKRRNKSMYRWIVKTPIEVVRQHLRFECMYCNFYEGFHGEYPPVEETPIWLKSSSGN